MRSAPQWIPHWSHSREGGVTTSPQGSPGYQQPSAGLPQQYQRAAEEEDEEDTYTKQNLQMSKKNFAGIDKDTHVPILALKGRNLPYVIRAGWDIPAILEQKAISDLPGELRARVRQNVYDTDTGKYLLIAQNSILTGKYNSDVAYAQNRLQINWDRLEMLGVPTIFLNHMNGQDNDGGTGLNGNVNNHYKRLIGFAAGKDLRCWCWIR